MRDLRFATVHRFHLARMCVPLLLAAALFGGCASAPTQELDAYRGSFAAARTAAEDVVLRTKVAAKTLAEYPENSDPAPVRIAKLQQRIQDADSRLLAIQTIDRYNTVLVQLAEGKDPKAIQGNLESFGASLQAFGYSRLSSLAAEAIPYVGVAAEIIALAEETQNRREFVRLVQQGREPVLGMIDILVADANSLQTIAAEQYAMKRERHAARIDDLKFQFQNWINWYGASPEIDALVQRVNAERGKRKDRSVSVISHTPGTQSPLPADLTFLRLVVDTTAQEVTLANSFTDKIAVHAAMIEEYRKLLDATRRSFLMLERAIELNRRVATIDFVQRALALRQAVLELREGQ